MDSSIEDSSSSHIMRDLGNNSLRFSWMVFWILRSASVHTSILHMPFWTVFSEPECSTLRTVGPVVCESVTQVFMMSFKRMNRFKWAVVEVVIFSKFFSEFANINLLILIKLWRQYLNSNRRVKCLRQKCIIRLIRYKLKTTLYNIYSPCSL